MRIYLFLRSNTAKEQYVSVTTGHGSQRKTFKSTMLIRSADWNPKTKSFRTNSNAFRLYDGAKTRMEADLKEAWANCLRQHPKNPAAGHQAYLDAAQEIITGTKKKSFV